MPSTSGAVMTTMQDDPAVPRPTEGGSPVNNERALNADDVEYIKLHLPVFMQNLRQLEERWSYLEDTLADLKSRVGNLEQYLRSNSLLWHDFPMPASKLNGIQFLEYVVEKLNELLPSLYQPVELSNIDIAHKLFTRKKSVKTILLIKFTNRWSRNDVMFCRKDLAGTKMTITEHLTAENIKLLNMAKSAAGFKNAWSANGKIFMLIHGRKRVVRSERDLPPFHPGNYNQQIPRADVSGDFNPPVDHGNNFHGNDTNSRQSVIMNNPMNNYSSRHAY